MSQNSTLKIVCWKWHDPNFKHRDSFTFTHEHVNRLKRMVARHVTIPYEFCCITDFAKGIDDDVRIIPLWHDDKLSGLGGCYIRLKCFDPIIKDIIGERFIWLDLDMVIVRNIDHIVGRTEDFIMWGDTAINTHYNGSICMMNAGARPMVYDTFEKTSSPGQARSRRIVGTDQAWISYVLGGNEKKFNKNDGVYSFRNDFVGVSRKELPSNASIIVFHGQFDPSQPRIQEDYPWVKENWK